MANAAMAAVASIRVTLFIKRSTRQQTARKTKKDQAQTVDRCADRADTTMRTTKLAVLAIIVFIAAAGII
jgi:hypothetical protein